MLLKTYENLVNEIQKDKSNLHCTKEELLRILPQAKFDELVVKMKKEKDWESSSVIRNLDNYLEVSPKFRSFSETYVGIEGISDKVIGFISCKPDTSPGELVIEYRKDGDMQYIQCDDGAPHSEAVFHPNHSLIWIVKTNNRVHEKPDQTAYGEGVKYIIYIYSPSDEVKKNCLIIKEREELKNAGVFEQIRDMQIEHKHKIKELKNSVGLKD